MLFALDHGDASSSARASCSSFVKYIQPSAPSVLFVIISSSSEICTYSSPKSSRRIDRAEGFSAEEVPSYWSVRKTEIKTRDVIFIPLRLCIVSSVGINAGYQGEKQISEGGRGAAFNQSMKQAFMAGQGCNFGLFVSTITGQNLSCLSVGAGWLDDMSSRLTAVESLPLENAY